MEMRRCAQTQSNSEIHPEILLTNIEETYVKILHYAKEKILNLRKEAYETIDALEYVVKTSGDEGVFFKDILFPTQELLNEINIFTETLRALGEQS